MAYTPKKHTARTYAPPKINVGSLVGAVPPPPAGTLGMGMRPGDIERNAMALVNMQSQPALAAIDRQQGMAQVQGKGMQDRAVQLYERLGGQYQDQLGKYNAGAQQSQQAMQAIGTAHQNAVTQGYTDAATRMGQDAATRGPGLDGGASAALASQMGAAQARASADTTSAATAQQQTQDAYRGLIQSMAASAPGRGTELAGQIGLQTQREMGDLGMQRANIVQQRGAQTATMINQLNQQAFNNYATGTMLGLRHDQIAANLAMGTGRIGLGYDKLNEGAATNADKLTQGETKLQQGAERNQVAWGRLKNQEDKFGWQKRLAGQVGAGGLKGLTPWQQKQVLDANSNVRNAIQAVGPTGDAFHQAMTKGADGKMHHLTPEQIHAGLLKKFGNDADVVDAGVELAHGHGLSPDTVARLKARRVGVPSRWNPNKPPGYKATQGA